MTSINLKRIHKRLGHNSNETGVDLDYHLCHMIHCVKNERKCGPYSSLKKKIRFIPLCRGNLFIPSFKSSIGTCVKY